MSIAENNRRISKSQSFARLIAILAGVFLTTLIAGTVIGGIFVRDALLDERHEQAQIHLKSFETSLKTVLSQTDTLGAQLAAALVADRLSATGTLDRYMASMPWAMGVIIRQPTGTTIYPSSMAKKVADLPLPTDGDLTDKIFGPFALTNGDHAMVFRYVKDGEALDLVVSLHAILEAVGFMELDQSALFTVKTDTGEGGSVILGDEDDLSDDVASTEIKAGNSRWTISIAPRDLSEAPHDWVMTLRILLLLLVLAFAAPAVVLVWLVRKHLADSAQLQSKSDEVENLSRKLSVALESSKIGLWEHDTDSTRQIWDDQILKIYGMEGESNIQSFESWLSCVHPDDRKRFRALGWEDAERRNGRVSEYRIVTPAGEEKSIRSVGNAYIDSTGHRKFVGVNWDISADVALQNDLAEAKHLAEAKNIELESARQRLEVIANKDPLTGLANRRRFEAELNAIEIDGTVRADTKIIIIDLDGFKSINDTLGHFFGDDVLKHAAQVFSDKLGPGDFLARTGGDEFIAIVPPQADAQKLAEAILSAFSGSVRIADRNCRVGASIGIAVAQGLDETAGDLLIKADIALYEAKRRGRGRIVTYSEELMERTFSHKRLGDELQDALETGQIAAFFQPIVNMHTMEVIGVEALARWLHPRHGLLSPHRFIETAEKIGIIREIDKIVFDKAIALARRCKSEGIPMPPISVNVSSERLQDPDLLRQISEMDLPPQALHFELLESIQFDEADASLLGIIEKIRALGVAIDLDDFGSGYASLVGLMNVRPDRLKIARQLVEPVLTSPVSALVISTIVEIAKSLGIEVICEGVLSEAHAEILKNLGLSAAQGYHFAHPMDEAQFVAYLSSRSADKKAQ